MGSQEALPEVVEFSSLLHIYVTFGVVETETK